MSRRSWPSRFALWAAVCALLLRAAVPLFAAGAAQMRGVSVAEVCAVYGVALPGASHASHAEHAGHALHHADPSEQEDHRSHSGAAHAGDHCALTALAALAPSDAPGLAIPAANVAASEPRSTRYCAFRDRCALWVARLKQGPPLLTRS